MFFIYLLLFFAFDFFALFFGKNIAMPGTELYRVLTIFQYAFLVIFSVTFIVTVIQQLALHTTFKSLLEELKSDEAKIKLAEDKYRELSVYFEKYLGNDFPKFEKEILTAIAQKPEKLLAIFQTYPELQSSFTMTKLIDKVDALVHNIYEKRKEAESTKRRINTLLSCPWLIVKPTI